MYQNKEMSDGITPKLVQCQCQSRFSQRYTVLPSFSVLVNFITWIPLNPVLQQQHNYKQSIIDQFVYQPSTYGNLIRTKYAQTFMPNNRQFNILGVYTMYQPSYGTRINSRVTTSVLPLCLNIPFIFHQAVLFQAAKPY